MRNARRAIFALLVCLMGGWMPAQARWELVGEDETYEYPAATNYKNLAPGKYVILRTGAAQDQGIYDFTYLMGNNMSFENDDLMEYRNDSYVFLLEDAGTNELTGRQMVRLKNVGTGKYLGAVGAGADPWAASAVPTFVDGTTDAYRILLLPADGQGAITPGDSTAFATYTSGSVEGSGYTDPDGTPLVRGWGYDEQGNCTGTVLAIDPTTTSDRMCILNNFGTTGSAKQIITQNWSAWMPWLIYEVNYIDDPLYTLQWGVQQYSEMTAEGYSLGDGYITYNVDSVAAYNAVLTYAKDVAFDQSLTSEQALAILDSLAKARAAVEATRQGGFAAGFYYLVSADKDLGDTRAALTVSADKTALAYTKFSAADGNQIFEIGGRNGEGSQSPCDYYNILYLKHVASGQYVGTTANLVPDAVTFCMYALGSNSGAYRGEGAGQWDFIESSGWSGGIGLNNLTDLDRLGTDEDTIARTVTCPQGDSWSHIISGDCAFYLVPVDPNIDIDSLIAASAKTQIAIAFNKSLAEARTLYAAVDTAATTDDLKAAFAALHEAIATAEAVTEPAQPDVDAIDAAIAQFRTSTGKAAQVVEAITAAQTFLDGAGVATDDQDFGKYSEEALTRLRDFIDAIDLSILSTKSNDELQSLLSRINEELAAAKESMVMPFSEGKWYVLENVSSPDAAKWPAGGTYETKGAYIYADGATSGSSVKWAMPEANFLKGDPRTYWRFVKVEGGYAIQNGASGLYIDNSAQAAGLGATWALGAEPTPFAFVVSTFDDDDNTYFTFQTPVGGADWEGTIRYGLLHADASGNLVGWDHYNARIGSAWQFNDVSEDEELLLSSLTRQYVNNTYNIVTMPGTYSTFPEGAEVFSILGRSADDAGNTARLFLKQMSEDELTALPAGTPVVMRFGDPSQDYDATNTVVVNMNLNNPETIEPVTVQEGRGGLVGNLFSALSLAAGYDNFIGGKINSAAATLPVYSGYINPAAVPVLLGNYEETGDYDAVIQTDGLTDKISSVRAAAHAEPVNVYTAEGMLVKKNAKASEATKNLPRGIYIVGNKKLLVK